MSHIPTKTIEEPTFLITPYPDNNGQIISENIAGKFYLHNNHVISTLTKNIIKDHCIVNIIKHEAPTCTFQKYRNDYFIQYINPNILITWNITREKLNQNCNSQEIYIENNKIVKVFNCTAELKQVLISNNIQQYTNLIFTEHNVTKIEPISHIEIKEMILLSNKNDTIYKNLIIIILFALALSCIFYIYKKFKTTPNNIIIKYLKPKTAKINQTIDEEIEKENKLETVAEVIAIETPIPQLYPNINT